MSTFSSKLPTHLVNLINRMVRVSSCERVGGKTGSLRHGRQEGYGYTPVRGGTSVWMDPFIVSLSSHSGPPSSL